MAQAARITTAIRQLMSRGQPPKSTGPIRLAGSERRPNIIAGDLTGSALALSRQAVVAPQIGRAGQADAWPTPQLRWSAPAARARSASGFCR